MQERTQGPRVLVVEDDAANQELLRLILERAGYAAIAASDGKGALEAVSAQHPDLVLLDVGLPGIDGLEVCRRLRSEPATLTLPIIMLTGRSGVDDIVAGLDAGADDFVGKPFQPPELLARIRSSLRLRRAIDEMEAAHGVVAALANAVEAKDATTERHCQRLAAFAYRLGLGAGLEGPDLKGVVFGALLHDVGKIGISEAVLTKPGPLTAPEWSEMRRHPEIGERICQPLSAARLFAPIVRHHHERWDGAGYPDGLQGEAIPIGARIVGLVDAFDAMTHDRPYRAARSVDAALEEVEKEAGRQFDPAVARLFVSTIGGAGGSAPNDIPSDAFVSLASKGS
jgi:putative two-component system response regulator